MEKPLDMTDPTLDDDSPKTNMEEQEKFLNLSDIYLSKLKGKGLKRVKTQKI